MIRTSAAVVESAVSDPGYHRYLMFGAADRVRENVLGTTLEDHERQSRLPWPQRQTVERVERAIADRKGETIVIRYARQTGKNEVEAFLETRALGIWRSVPGSIWVRTAPTWRPQIVNSILRLEKHLKEDPVIGGRWGKRQGFIYESGHAQVHFLSADKQASVVGETASIALSVDEAHCTDQDKYDRELAPFTASTNAPTLLCGVASGQQDLLYFYRDKLDGTDCVLEFPASVWCDLSPAYAGHYTERVRLLGADHPVIKMEYDLKDLESVGTYLNSKHRAALFSGDHVALEGPRDNMLYSLLVDIGGESESDLDDVGVRGLEPERDSTNYWIVEVDPEGSTDPYPLARIVSGEWWTGRSHLECLPDLCELIEHWNISMGVIDARGVGEATAMAISRKFPFIQAYKASNIDVSEDCYDLLARINTGRVRFWKADPDADKVIREVQAQVRSTRYELRAGPLMKITKSNSVNAASRHIDGVKALTYLGRSLQNISIIEGSGWL